MWRRPGGRDERDVVLRLGEGMVLAEDEFMAEVERMPGKVGLQVRGRNNLPYISASSHVH